MIYCCIGLCHWSNILLGVLLWIISSCSGFQACTMISSDILVSMMLSSNAFSELLMSGSKCSALKKAWVYTLYSSSTELQIWEYGVVCSSFQLQYLLSTFFRCAEGEDGGRRHVCDGCRWESALCTSSKAMAKQTSKVYGLCSSVHEGSWILSSS